MKENFNILVIDDEEEICNSVVDLLRGEFDVFCSNSLREGFQKLRLLKPDIILLDIKLPDGSGIEAIYEIKVILPESKIIMISGISDVEMVVESIKNGAFDYVDKPISAARLLASVRNAIENIKLREKLTTIWQDGMITKSDKMKEVLDLVKKASRSNLPVLILGESGTGKEKIANLIHILSKRRDNSFIKVNCSAVPSELFESEFFGYEKGAFTGAVGTKKGKFEMADRGTLFLDEIGDLSIEHQAKILRAIEYGEITRVGGKETIKVDVRIISATNKNLEEMTREKTFREDLLYRINVITIYLPPLRERKEDIKHLSEIFLSEISNSEGISKTFSDEAIKKLEEYDFPGNIRELRNIVYRLFINSERNIITNEDVEKVLRSKNSKTKSDYFEKVYEILEIPQNPQIARKKFEEIFILYHLEKNNFNISKTSRSLNILPNNLIRRIKELNIDYQK